MPILIALADVNSGPLLGRQFAGWGEEATVVADGQTACAELLRAGGPRLAVVDCALTNTDGLAVCRQVRAADPLDRPYLILVGLSRMCPDVPSALACGADDYVPYPVALDELLARVGVGKRTLAWQQELRVRCTPAAAPNNTLTTLCVYCKSVRAADRWQTIEQSLSAMGHQCSHAICPTCYDARVRPELAALAGEAG
jgi:DNA-binding response OmpR family regulator